MRAHSHHSSPPRHNFENPHAHAHAHQATAVCCWSVTHLDLDELELPLKGLEADVQVILLLIHHLCTSRARVRLEQHAKCYRAIAATATRFFARAGAVSKDETFLRVFSDKNLAA